MNEHFSVEHAEAHYGGEESEMNPKFEWEDELSITNDVSEVVIHEDAIYPLQGDMPNGDPFHFEVPKMCLFELKSDTGSTYVGCSESILNGHELEVVDDTYILKVIIKELEPMSNPTPGIYIAAQEFPKELIF